MRLILVYPFLLYSLFAHTQIEKYPIIILGTESAGTISLPAKKGNGFPSIQHFSFTPHMDIRLFNNFYFGPGFEFDFGWVEGEKINSTSAWGAQAKYFFIPFSDKSKLSKWFLFNGEIAIRTANYFLDHNEKYGIGILDGYKNVYYDIGFIVNIHLFDNLYVYTGYRGIYYDHNDIFKSGPKVGIQYHFGETRINENKIPKSRPKRNSFNSQKLPKSNEQLRFGQRFLYGTSLTYIPQFVSYSDLVYHELTWTNRISVNVGKSIYLGLHYLSIYTSGSIVNNSKSISSYNVFGIKATYDFLPSYDDGLFLESSFNLGNYCTCGNLDPFLHPKLYYWGLGLRYDYPLLKRLALNVGFTNYVILNRIADKYNFTQYTLGISINMGKPYIPQMTKIRSLM
jgi:hypothetical protein